MLTARFDMKFVEDSILELERRGTDLRKPFRVIRKEMRLDTRDHAKKKEGPEGKWPARAPSTRAKVRKGSGRARRLMGRLPSAVEYFAEKRRVVGRSKARRWAHIHMTGGTVANGAKIPPRPFLWISDKLIDTAATVLGRWLVNGWGRR